jgi:DNA-directed RNA polymerase specialized sigma24 family protein
VGALDANSVLLAILALMVDERERAAKLDPSMSKTEVLLDSVGLSHPQIAKVLSKNTAAVRMMVARSKAKTRKFTSSSDGDSSNG